MRFLDRLRIRQVIALIVVAPVLVGVITTSVLAKNAHDSGRLAQAELADLDLLLTVRDVEAGFDGELAFYFGWLETQSATGFESQGLFILATKSALTETVVEGFDDAFARGSQVSLGPEAVEALVVLEDSIGDARVAFADGDLPALRVAAAKGEAATEIIDALGDDVIARRGLRWLAIDLQSTFSNRIGDEILDTTTTLIAGVPTTEDRQRLAVLMDRTDQALEALLDASEEEQADRISTTFRGTQYWSVLRPTVLDPTMVEPLPLDSLISSLNDVVPFTDDLRAVRGESADLLAAAAADRAADADRDRLVMLSLAIALVVLPSMLVIGVGGRLSRRVGLLAAAAERVSAGELGVRVDEIGGTDEISVLAAAFNEVSATIATSHEQISALADGRTNDPVFESELPGIVGHTLRLALRRLGNATAELAHQASHDKLTGLLDRRGLQHGLDDAAAATRWSVILVDLDGFKLVNDQFGHSAGDAVLAAAANRLSSSVRDDDLVARLGGDEFALAVNASSGAPIESTIDRIVTEVARPVTWEGNELVVTCSVGWTQMAPDEDFGAALHRADQAMYQAKRSGKSQALHA